MVMWVVGSGGGQSVCVCVVVCWLHRSYCVGCLFVDEWSDGVCRCAATAAALRRCDRTTSSSLVSEHEAESWSRLQAVTGMWDPSDLHLQSSAGGLRISRGGSSCSDHTKPNTQPHLSPGPPPVCPQSQHKDPSQPGQETDRPPKNPPLPSRHTSPDAQKAAAAQPPPPPYRTLTLCFPMGRGEHSFCSLASSSTNTPQPPICAEQLIPKKCKKKKNCESAAQGKQFNFHCGVNPEADVEALMFPHIQTASSLLYFSCNALQKWIIINIIISYQSINHSAEPKLHPSRKAGLWCYVCVQLCRCLPATNTKVCELENQRHSSREQEKHRRWLPWLFSLFLTLCSSESKSSTQIACFRHCSLVTVHSYSMQTMSR